MFSWDFREQLGVFKKPELKLDDAGSCYEIMSAVQPSKGANGEEAEQDTGETRDLGTAADLNVSEVLTTWHNRFLANRKTHYPLLLGSWESELHFVFYGK
ncbi:uncharacterized protein PG986_014714 [Apiospora aurea]|uniref:Uncharacterized protein n=1 Tax=Apiospora aurea TaxID=335848 RepID=A0ABR1PTS2_9PEZI